MNEVKTADEMLEELGYKKIYDDELVTRYKFVDQNYIGDYFVDDFVIEFSNLYKSYSKRPINVYYLSTISLEEHKAINKKMQELGWI